MERRYLIQSADQLLLTAPFSITDYPAPKSAGGPNDYYSDGSYWWPDPDKPDGLPYIRRDGFLNPENFVTHKNLLLRLVHETETLYKAYLESGRQEYLSRCLAQLRTFFSDKEKRMNPQLLYSQAIPGICTGRSIGLIDTLQLIDIPFLLRNMEKQKVISKGDLEELAGWFTSYSDWLFTSGFGKTEFNEKNNHSITLAVQLAAFSEFNPARAEIYEACRRKITEEYIPRQIAADGSFPEELKRTRPYSYSVFALENLVTLCWILYKHDIDLWSYKDDRGIGISEAISFLAPYLRNKEAWPYGADVEGFEAMPPAATLLFFAARAYGDGNLQSIWNSLEGKPVHNAGEDRNTPVKWPGLYL